MGASKECPFLKCVSNCFNLCIFTTLTAGVRISNFFQLQSFMIYDFFVAKGLGCCRVFLLRISSGKLFLFNNPGMSSYSGVSVDMDE